MAAEVLAAAHAASAAALAKAKAACSEACADEAVHAPHRAALEGAYAAFEATALALAAHLNTPLEAAKALVAADAANKATLKVTRSEET